MSRSLRLLATTLGLLLLGGVLSGCIIEEPGGYHRHCWWWHECH